MAMSQERYVHMGGLKCPNCESGGPEGNSFDTEPGYLYLEMSCNGCEAEWAEKYKLVSYINLEVDTGADN